VQYRYCKIRAGQYFFKYRPVYEIKVNAGLVDSPYKLQPVTVNYTITYYDLNFLSPAFSTFQIVLMGLSSPF
jgi:hypothetical protein